ncbi:MAG: hypothetical protein LUE98_20160 [Tannerellaceae bacterium]|nr:hypothetical protein [Tannerellaceae bacterium]
MYFTLPKGGETAKSDANQTLCIMFASYFASLIWRVILFIHNVLLAGVMQRCKLFDKKTFWKDIDIDLNLRQRYDGGMDS